MKKIIFTLLFFLLIGNICFANGSFANGSFANGSFANDLNIDNKFNNNFDNYHLKKLHSDVYVVKDGDTLRSIAKQFITEERIIFEFEEGIVEGNYSVFENHESKTNFSKEVLPGDILIIYNRK